MRNHRKRPPPKRLRQAARKTSDGFLMTDGKKVIVQRRRGFQAQPQTGRQ